MAQANPIVCTVTADRPLADRLRRAIEPLGGSHTAFDSLMTGFRRLDELSPSILILDSRTAGLTVDQLGLKLRLRVPCVDLFVIDDGSRDTESHDLVRWGIALIASDIEPEELESRLKSALMDRERVLRCGWVGISRQIRAASDLLLAAAQADVTVLIEGESGTGKELAARAVHTNSPRSTKPFLALNCSAFPETLLESELFGHEKAAFTDAFGKKRGIFEAVEGGTIFLDEIGETSSAVQSRLLRVLEEHQVRPLGATRTTPVDFRVVAATNRVLQHAVAEGVFRRDLYFRLAVVQLTLSPLRERKADIPALLHHHLNLNRKPAGSLTSRFEDESLARLVDYVWPGNVRELRNFVERAQVRFPTGKIDREMAGSLLETVRPSANLPVPTGRRADHVEREMIFAALSELKRDLDFLRQRVETLSSGGIIDAEQPAPPNFASMREVERERIVLALKQTHGNRAKAAKLLGVGERTLYRKLKEYGLQPNSLP